MQPARIAELLEPFVGAPGKTGHLAPHISTYIDILLRWNARINLTAVRDPDQIVTRHFGESLFAARNLLPATGKPDQDSAQSTKVNIEPLATGHHLTVADLGSGAGFPGIPLKLWAPEIVLTLIESNHKKVTFLREVARALALSDVDIRNTRAEALPTSDAFDLVTLRAVERFPQVLHTAVQHLAPGGRIALLIGHSQVSHAQAALGIAWQAPLPIPQSHSRLLLVGSKLD